jgi:hypothetical protein
VLVAKAFKRVNWEYKDLKPWTRYPDKAFGDKWASFVAQRAQECNLAEAAAQAHCTRLILRAKRKYDELVKGIERQTVASILEIGAKASQAPWE